MAPPSPLLAPKRGSKTQLVCTTIPLVCVLIYFLYVAWKRPSAAVYNLGQNYSAQQWQAAQEESGALVSLMDILLVFLFLHICWTVFAVYVITFVAKRRHLVGRYFTEGESTVGDVIYDKTSRFCGGFHDYGYCIYAHPNRAKVVRKRVRVYQAYTRERVTILRLPNRPLSGQSKVDLEIDLSAASKERDSYVSQMSYFSIAWVVFTLLGACFVLYQISKIDDAQDNISTGKKFFLVLVGLNVPFAYAVNWGRFLLYRNWMINRGALVDDNADTRKIRGCLSQVASEDGSDVIPYSILNEEELSYQGSVPSHAGSTLPQAGGGGQLTSDNVDPFSSENDKPMPWSTA